MSVNQTQLELSLVPGLYSRYANRSARQQSHVSGCGGNNDGRSF